MSHNSIFKHALFIGPNYINHKGGIGAVLMTYQREIKEFNFISTYDGNVSSFTNILVFIKSFINTFWILLSVNKIKIVHIHSASRGSFYRKYIVFLLSKYIFQKKVIFHLHGAEFHLFYDKGSIITRFCIRHLFKNVDHTICLSTYWFNFISATFKNKGISILNNPIEWPENKFEKDHKVNKMISLLFLGRIGQRKGVFDLLEVLNKGHERYRKKLILKIGGDGEIEKLKEYLDSKQLHDVVEYVGWVSDDLKSNLLTECDILILPSYNEGLPISILEAMSYGKAIISTPVGGIPEVVKNGRNGFLIEPGNIIALEKCLDWILQNQEELPKMGLVSSNLVQNYDIKKVVNQLGELYIKILK